MQKNLVKTFRFSQFLTHITILSLLYFSTSTLAETEFKLAHMFADESLPALVASRFSRLVAEKSQGEMTVKIYGNGYLGDERRNLLLLNEGKLDFAVTGDLVISYLDKHNAVVNMPFIYSTPQQALSIYDSDIGQNIRQELKTQHGIEALSWHYVGTRVLTTNRPVQSVKDLKGLKLRLPPDHVWRATWKALGTQPKSIQFNSIQFTELYSALERKRVEAQENPPNFIRSQNFYEVQKYLVLTNHLPQRQFIFFSNKSSSDLSSEQRTLLKQAAQEASAWATETATRLQAKDIEWLTTKGGMQLIEFNDEGVSASIKAVPTQIAGEKGKKMFQIIQNYH